MLLRRDIPINRLASNRSIIIQKFHQLETVYVGVIYVMVLLWIYSHSVRQYFESCVLSFSKSQPKTNSKCAFTKSKPFNAQYNLEKFN